MKEIKLIIEDIPEEQGGGYEASVEGMRFYLVGDGDTAIEALESLLEMVKSEQIDDLFEYCKKMKRRHGL